MTREEFKKHIAGLNDYKLYLMIRNVSLNSLFGSHSFEWKADALFEESEKRKSQIYDKACSDAFAIFSWKELQTSETAVSDILRPELFGDKEYSETDNTLTSEAAIDSKSAALLRNLMPPDSSANFVCRVTGDSMIGENIFNGDIIVVDTRATDVVGKLVLASISGVLFVKRLIMDNDRLFLNSANPKYKPVNVNRLPDCKIIGTVISVIHQVD
jgi:hypothetical protein